MRANRPIARVTLSLDYESNRYARMLQNYGPQIGVNGQYLVSSNDNFHDFWVQLYLGLDALLNSRWWLGLIRPFQVSEKFLSKFLRFVCQTSTVCCVLSMIINLSHSQVTQKCALQHIQSVFMTDDHNTTIEDVTDENLAQRLRQITRTCQVNYRYLGRFTSSLKGHAGFQAFDLQLL